METYLGKSEKLLREHAYVAIRQSVISLRTSFDLRTMSDSPFETDQKAKNDHRFIQKYYDEHPVVRIVKVEIKEV